MLGNLRLPRDAPPFIRLQVTEMLLASVYVPCFMYGHGVVISMPLHDSAGHSTIPARVVSAESPFRFLGKFVFKETRNIEYGRQNFTPCGLVDYRAVRV